MNFTLAQSTFPSLTHKSIWHTAIFLTPFIEFIPPSLTGQAADDLRLGERNFYQFMLDLYTDMYQNPVAYYLPVGEYDRYMNGRERNELEHKSDPKESSLRNKFQQAIQFYQRLLLR